MDAKLHILLTVVLNRREKEIVQATIPLTPLLNYIHTIAADRLEKHKSYDQSSRSLIIESTRRFHNISRRDCAKQTSQILKETGNAIASLDLYNPMRKVCYVLPIIKKNTAEYYPKQMKKSVR